LHACGNIGKEPGENASYGKSVVEKLSGYLRLNEGYQKLNASGWRI